MKTTILSIALFLLSVAVFAQSEKYVDAMKNSLASMKDAKTPADLTNVSAAFERIGNAEKTQWLPFYYAALTQVRVGYADQAADKDVIAKKVSELIEKGEAINKNADFCALRYMNATLQLIVNPMERWQTKGAEAEEAYQAGLAFDPNNPRLYYLKAMTLLNTPPQFGGGMEAAKPLFQKAIDVAQNVKQTDALMPSWGAEEAKKALEEN